MDSNHALNEDTPVNRVVKKIYGSFEDGFSLFDVFCMLNEDEWEEFKRFIDLPKTSIILLLHVGIGLVIRSGSIRMSLSPSCKSLRI